MALQLREGRGFYALEVMGLGEEVWEDPRMELRGERLAEEVIKVRRVGICLLGGYWSNGMAALEMARKLIEKGR
ncbi:MAG: hypothetical protein N2035_09840 [Chthoniobacterales bacterium]|nr:hypothetical protein [Chthoniobacterales bacterium]